MPFAGHRSHRGPAAFTWIYRGVAANHFLPAWDCVAFQFAGGEGPAAPFPGCGPDPTADGLDCLCFVPCGLDCGRVLRSDNPQGGLSSPTTEKRGGEFVRLTPAPIVRDGTIEIPVSLLGPSPLLGFEFQVAYDPAKLEFLALHRAGALELDYLSAAAWDGVVRLRGIPDMQMLDPLTAEEHAIGTLAFRLRAGVTSEGSGLGELTVQGVRLVRTDLSAILAEGAGISPVTPGAGDCGPTGGFTLPSPFPVNGRIELSLVSRGGPAAVAVYDVQGRCVRRLFEGTAGAAKLTLTWDGRGESGEPAPSGIYYVRAEAGKERYVRKLLFLQ